MIIIFGIELFICYVYLVVISWIANQWDEIEEVRVSNKFKPKNTYSIIIPYRNEVNYLERCINSLLLLDGNIEHEIITVNDHSEDESRHLMNQFRNDHIIHLDSSEFGKKAAIQRGIQEAKNHFIITLDADCVVHKDWLKLIEESISNLNLDVLVGPVKFYEDQSFLSRFQFMDISVTMATTAAGIRSKKYFLSNGANFIYKKSLFDSVEGYDGNKEIASGDDVFLLEKFVNKNVEIGFLKSNRGAVISHAENSWINLFKQRKRWATKTKAYANKNILKLQGFIFGMSLISIINFIILPFIIGDAAIIIGMFVLFIKGVIDFLLLNKMVHFFGGKKILRAFLPAFITYPFYYIIIGLQALIPTKVDWKGRKV